MLKMSLGLVSGAALITMLTYGCSSESNNPTGTPDSGTTTPTDGGKGKETSTPPGDGGGEPECKPQSVDNFTPTWKKPTGFHQGICSETQAEALLCLFDSAADSTQCQALIDDKANEDCYQCIYTASSAKELGPVVVTSDGLGSLNMAGCIALSEGDTSANGCGAKLQASDQCGNEACEAACPVPNGDDQALQAYNDCTDQASSSVCQEFTTAADCATDLLKAGGAAEQCAQGKNFLARGIALAKLFCAGATGDGGTDAAKDAPADGG